MRHEESDTQCACVRWFRLQYPEFHPLLFAVPNGGARNLREGARLKREGVVAGVADLILLMPRGGFHALCIEMKTDEGHQSKEQKAWQKAVEEQGAKYVVCRSFDDFYNVVTNYISVS